MSRPHLLRLSRHLCSRSRSASAPAPLLETLPSPLRGEARAVSSLLQTARSACLLAGGDMSDDVERQHARQLTKHALSRYVSLVARGTPPVALSAHASRVLGEEHDVQHAKRAMTDRLQPRNDVMHALGDEAHSLRLEVFRSNRQRIWVGWRGWF